MTPNSELSILVVDDEYEIQRPYLCSIVKSSLPGAQILEAGSVEEALRHIDSHPGLMAAIVDVGLPDRHGQRGLEVLRYLRDHQPNCMRILITSQVPEREVRDRTHVEAYVSLNHPKSSPRTMLNQALNEALHRHWRRLESVPAVVQ